MSISTLRHELRRSGGSEPVRRGRLTCSVVQTPTDIDLRVRIHLTIYVPSQHRTQHPNFDHAAAGDALRRQRRAQTIAAHPFIPQRAPFHHTATSRVTLSSSWGRPASCRYMLTAVTGIANAPWPLGNRRPTSCFSTSRTTRSSRQSHFVVIPATFLVPRPWEYM